MSKADDNFSLFGPALPIDSPEAQALEQRMNDAKSQIEADKQRATQEFVKPVVVVPQATSTRASDMHPTALVFLEDPLARKLAVAWASCEGREEEWFGAAGMSDSFDARRICKALRVNGICREGGVTDARALAYIAAIVAEPLQKRLKGTNDNKRNA